MRQEDLKESLRKFYAKNDKYHTLIDGAEKTGLTYDDILASLIDKARTPDGRVRLLDIALGTGHYIGKAAGLGALACGIDLSFHACTMARKRDASLGAIQSDAECLPFRDCSFDVVLCLQLLEHTVYPEHIVREISRVLKPGGYLFLSAPNLLGSNVLTKTYRMTKAILSGRVKELKELPTDILDRWDEATSADEVADIDACNRTNIFQMLKLLRANSMSIEYTDTMRHPKKYKPARLAMARIAQKIPVVKNYGINFKIIARKKG